MQEMSCPTKLHPQNNRDTYLTLGDTTILQMGMLVPTLVSERLRGADSKAVICHILGTLGSSQILG